MWYSVNHTRFPEEDHIPDWVCRDEHGNKCDRVQAEQFFTYLYLNTKTQDHFLHIVCYLHFTMTKKLTRMMTIMTGCGNKESFWYSQCCILKFYNPSGHLAIVLFQGKVAFKQYISKKHTRSKSKFTSSVTHMATHDMEVHFGKDSKWTTKTSQHPMLR
jgi:hypothetical protein